MKKLKLPRMSTDIPTHTPCGNEKESSANLLRKEFMPKAPNLVWASGFTYVQTRSKWYYLCIIMDLYSGEIIAWHISSKADTKLVSETFQKAYQRQNTPYGLMFCADRGPQYTCLSFRQLLDSCNVVPSFSKKDFSFGSACCKSFFTNWKKETEKKEPYDTVHKLYREVSAYVERYNSMRPFPFFGMF